jgi:hypothetical protein
MVTIPQCRDFLVNTITSKFSTFFFSQVSQVQAADAYPSYVICLASGEGKHAYPSYVICLASGEGKHAYGDLLALCIKLGRSE